MKNTYLIYLALLSLGIFAASCTQSVAIRMLQPAEMAVPEHIQTIVTIDRSKPSSGFITFLEGLATVEGINQDRRGRKEALEGLAYSLTRTPRFQVKHSDLTLEGSKGGINMTYPLDWAEVEKICSDYGADALIAIEAYDSDINVSTTPYEVKRKDENGNEYTETNYRAEANVHITIGWRFYDPQKKIILDEFSVQTGESYSATGTTAEQAKNNLPDLAYKAFDLSHAAGEKYGMRVAPVWVTVNRQFYTSGKKDFKEPMKKAARLAKQDQWEAAAQIWQRMVETADAKTAGRAAFNLAVASERLGYLETALKWAEKAYLEFNFKPARDYIQKLKVRLNDARLLEYQMHKKPST